MSCLKESGGLRLRQWIESDKGDVLVSDWFHRTWSARIPDEENPLMIRANTFRQAQLLEALEKADSDLKREPEVEEEKL
jgi:hypothetical protein